MFVSKDVTFMVIPIAGSVWTLSNPTLLDKYCIIVMYEDFLARFDFTTPKLDSVGSVVGRVSAY